MSEKKELMFSLFFSCIVTLLFFMAILYGTSAESWFADEHDSKCEMIENCGCYNRFINE